MKTIIPIKYILLEFTAVRQYDNMVPKRTLPRSNPIKPGENGSLTSAKTEATKVDKPKKVIALEVMKEQVKNQVPQVPQAKQ